MSFAIIHDVQLPKGKYAVMSYALFERIRAELVANPEIFRSVGDLQTWTLHVDRERTGDEKEKR